MGYFVPNRTLNTCLHTILSLRITSYIFAMYYPLFINHLFIHLIIIPLSNIPLGYQAYKVVIFSLILPLGSFKMKKKDRPFTSTLVVAIFTLEPDCFLTRNKKVIIFWQEKSAFFILIFLSIFTKIYRWKLQCQIIYPLHLSSQYFFFHIILCLIFTSLSLALLWQLFYLFCSRIVINTVIVTAGNFEP